MCSPPAKQGKSLGLIRLWKLGGWTGFTGDNYFQASVIGGADSIFSPLNLERSVGAYFCYCHPLARLWGKCSALTDCSAYPAD